MAGPPESCDIAVVGAGIVGLATARELGRRHPGAEIVVLEQESRITGHQSGHSSGVIHAGIYYEPGSLKARLCVEGARRLYEYCAEKEIEARRSGKLIVATCEAELPRLDELERRGRANGVAGLRLLGGEEIGEIEPHAAGLAALHSPATGTVDFSLVARALADDVRAGGGPIVTGCRVTAIAPAAGARLLRHTLGSTTASKAVFCAGAWSDRLAVAAGADPDPRIVPFRGAYVELRPRAAALVRASIYPVPDPALPFLGIHLTRTPDGRVLVGPTALMVAARDGYRLRRVRARDLRDTLAWPGTRRLARAHWRSGLIEIRRALSRRAVAAEARRSVPALRPADLRPSAHSGVRAQAVGRDGRLIDDFVVSESERAVHVRNAPSPAATACLALAEEIADRVDAIG